MSLAVLIRKTTPADFEEWLRMRLALWPDDTAAAHRAEMQVIAVDPANANFMAVKPDGALCGFLEAGIRKYAEGCDTSPVGYIEGWYVDEDQRLTGVGAALVRAAEDWARQIGCTEIASDCLLDNDISLRAHTALGYAEVERLIHFRKSLTG
jgi:aminoglycoside 6'-N-acetyltransferase I